LYRFPLQSIPNLLFFIPMRLSPLLFALLLPIGASAQLNSPAQWNARFGAPGLRHDQNFPESIHAFAASGDRLFIGGMFRDVNGDAAKGWAVWDGTTLRTAPGGGVEEDFGWTASSVIRTIAPFGDSFIVGGYFGRAGSSTARNLARYHIPSGTWTEFAGGTDHEVTALTLVGDTLWVGLNTSGSSTRRIHLPSQSWVYDNVPITQGPVSAIHPTSSGLFVAGQFPNTTHIRRYLNGVWSDVGGVSSTAGSNQAAIHALTDLDGYLIVGGEFDTVVQPDQQTASASRIARFHLTHQRWEPIPGGGLDGTAMSLTRFNSGFAVAGTFKEAGGTVVSRIARWSASGGWQEFDGGINRQDLQSTSFNAKALIVHGDELMVGGQFSQVRRLPEQVEVFNIVRWTTGGWKSLGEGLSGNHVRSIAIQHGQPDKILVVGDNVTYAGSARLFGVGVWNGSGWGTLRDGFSGRIGLPSPSGFPNTPGNGYQVVANENVAFIGGDFGYAEYDQRIGQFNGIGSFEDLQYVRTVAPDSDGLLYVGGTRFVNGIPTPFIQKWTGRIWRDLGPIEGSDVVTMVDIGGRLIAAGPFTSLKGTQASYLAQYDPATQSWTAFGQPNHEVHALHLTSTSLYVGGQFTQIGGIVANNIARYDLASGSWHALGDGISETWGPGGRVLAITTLGDLVFAGGLFSRAGTVPADNIARWNGSTWEELGGGTSDAVMALAADPSGLVYLGGSFLSVGDGLPSVRFAIWDQTDHPVSIDTWRSDVTEPEFQLHSAYPNPFNPTTTLSYSTPSTGRVRIRIVDLLGRQTALLFDGAQPAGRHELRIDGRSWASGVYLVVLQLDGRTISKPITLLK
jgi:hypothetical protein